MTNSNATIEAQNEQVQNAIPATENVLILNDLLKSIEQTESHVLHTSVIPAQSNLFCSPESLLKTLAVIKPQLVFVNFKKVGATAPHVREQLALNGITNLDAITEATVGFSADGIRLAAKFTNTWFLGALAQLKAKQVQAQAAQEKAKAETTA